MITITGDGLSIEAVVAIARNEENVAPLDPGVRVDMERSLAWVEKLEIGFAVRDQLEGGAHVVGRPGVGVQDLDPAAPQLL